MAEVDHDFVWPEEPVLTISRETLPSKLTVIAVAGNGGG